MKEDRTAVYLVAETLGDGCTARQIEKLNGTMHLDVLEGHSSTTSRTGWLQATAKIRSRSDQRSP